MFDDPASLNGHDEAGALPADLAEIHRRLLRDGTIWRQREPDVTRLARYVGSRVPRQAATSATPLIQDNRGHSPMHTDNADLTLPARNWPRKFVAGAMATFVVIFAIVLVNLATHRGNNTNPGSGGGTPIPFTPAPTNPTSCIPPTPGSLSHQHSIPPTPTPIATCIPPPTPTRIAQTPTPAPYKTPTPSSTPTPTPYKTPTPPPTPPPTPTPTPAP